MPHLWTETTRAAAADDAAGAPRWFRRLIVGPCAVGDATLVRADVDGGARWLVLGPPSVRVNGAPLVTGIAVLRDRDELLIDGARLYFSSEARPVVAPLQAGERAIRCPRCTVEIAPGTPAVACPGCGIWHHESDARRCWTHGSTCTACDQATAFDAPWRFDPAVLG